MINEINTESKIKGIIQTLKEYQNVLKQDNEKQIINKTITLIENTINNPRHITDTTFPNYALEKLQEELKKDNQEITPEEIPDTLAMLQFIQDTLIQYLLNIDQIITDEDEEKRIGINTENIHE